MLRHMREEEAEAETGADGETASIAPSELDKLDFSSKPSTSDLRSLIGKESTGSDGRSSNSKKPADRRNKENALVRWLRDGTVIYKSVGLGLMDLAVGMYLLKLAKEKGIGTEIEGF